MENNLSSEAVNVQQSYGNKPNERVYHCNDCGGVIHRHEVFVLTVGRNWSILTLRIRME